jgi:hypothetical protein
MRCPNCGHVNDLAAARTPAPQPVSPKTPSPLKSTNMYATLESQGASKSPSLNKTMLMGSGAAKAEVQKAIGLAKTMMGQAAPAPETRPRKPAETTPPPQTPVEARAPQKRVPTLPSLGSTEILPAPAMPPPPVPPELLTPVPQPKPVAAGSVPEQSQDTEADISIEIDTPPPAPPSRTSLPAWVVTEGIEDASTGPVLSPAATMLRARSTKIGAAALGVVGVIVAVVLMTRGGKPRPPVSVEVKRPPSAPVELARTEPTPPPVVAEPVKPAPPPAAVKPPTPSRVPAAAKAPPAKAPPATVTAPPTEMARKPSEPSRPRPVTAQPVAAENPAPERKVMVASAKHVAAATPTGEPARRPGLPTEEEQQLGREAYARGNAQLFQGHVDEAIASFKESLKHDSRNPAAQRGLGLAYVQAGNATQAVVFLKRYLKAFPTASDRPLIEKRIEQLSAR